MSSMRRFPICSIARAQQGCRAMGRSDDFAGRRRPHLCRVEGAGVVCRDGATDAQHTRQRSGAARRAGFMTMLYVYGLVDTPSLDGTPLKGHDGASVFAVRCGECAAATSYLSRHTIAPRPRSVWLHERVLDALMRRHAVLPLRFATIVPDVDMLRNRLRPMYHALAGDPSAFAWQGRIRPAHHQHPCRMP